MVLVEECVRRLQLDLVLVMVKRELLEDGGSLIKELRLDKRVDEVDVRRPCAVCLIIEFSQPIRRFPEVPWRNCTESSLMGCKAEVLCRGGLDLHDYLPLGTSAMGRWYKEDGEGSGGDGVIKSTCRIWSKYLERETSRDRYLDMCWRRPRKWKR